MFKSFLMNVSTLAVINLCTSIIFYLIPLIFFQIKSYSHLHYHVDARCTKPFRHVCANAPLNHKVARFCNRTHKYVLGKKVPAETGRHTGKEYTAAGVVSIVDAQVTLHLTLFLVLMSYMLGCSEDRLLPKGRWDTKPRWLILAAPSQALRCQCCPYTEKNQDRVITTTWRYPLYHSWLRAHSS